jgi:hypothetical protein
MASTKLSTVIARSVSDEAIHFAVFGTMDCFAALAMTEKIFEFGIPDRSALRTVRNDCA